MKIYIMLIFFSCFSLSLLAQDESICDFFVLKKEAEEANKQEDYDLAIKKYISAKTCDESKTKEIDEAILHVFDKINRLKKASDSLYQNARQTVHNFRQMYKGYHEQTLSLMQEGCLKPTLWLVTIGIDKYGHKDRDFRQLQGCVNDAEALATTFLAQEGKLYKKVNHYSFLNEKATTQAIIDTLNVISKKAQLSDVCFISISSHSDKDSLLTYNSTILGTDLYKLLKKNPAKVFLLLDVDRGENILSPIIEGQTSLNPDYMSQNIFAITIKEMSFMKKNRSVLSFLIENVLTTGSADADSNQTVYLDELFYAIKNHNDKNDRLKITAITPSSISNFPLYLIGDTFALPKREKKLPNPYSKIIEKAITNALSNWKELREETENIPLELNLSSPIYNPKLINFPHQLCDFNNIIKLDIGGNEITKLPSNCTCLQNIEEFSLENCNFTKFPNELTQCTKLQRLIVTHSPERRSGLIFDEETRDVGISSIPPMIKQLQSLVSLDLSNNILDSLPNEIGDLPKLIVLKLGNNRLKNLPPNFSQLQNLEELDLYDNYFEQFPDILYQCRKLKKLTITHPVIGIPNANDATHIITIKQKGLISLSSRIKELRELQLLDLSDNCITEFPSEFGSLQNLETLNLANNNFNKFPTEILSLKKLENLNLGGNKIDSLPDALAKLDSLKDFTFPESAFYIAPGLVRKYPKESLYCYQNQWNNLLNSDSLQKDTLFLQKNASNYLALLKICEEINLSDYSFFDYALMFQKISEAAIYADSLYSKGMQASKQANTEPLMLEDIGLQNSLTIANVYLLANRIEKAKLYYEYFIKAKVEDGIDIDEKDEKDKDKIIADFRNSIIPELRKEIEALKNKYPQKIDDINQIDTWLTTQ